VFLLARSFSRPRVEGFVWTSRGAPDVRDAPEVQ
jgi:hypothetical protein